MIKDAIKFILDLKRPDVVEVDGRKHLRGDLKPDFEPTPTPLSVSTLTGIVDYVKTILGSESNTMKQDRSGFLIHVVGYNRVSLRGPLYGPFLQRDILVQSTLDVGNFDFGHNYTQEEFLIALQANFQQSETILALMKICSTVSDIREMAADDNGISQEIIVKSGVVSRGSVRVENPITLIPYRTFHEAKQPEGLFVFRMKKAGDQILFSLHEADGGAWKNQAILNIKEYFQSQELDITIMA